MLEESQNIITHNWREGKRILLTESHTIGSLAVIRSLGRAGYQVIASSPKTDAISFYSNYCHQFCIHPPYHEKQAFLDWLDEFITQEKITLIIPSEGFLIAIRSQFEKWRPWLALPDATDTVYSAFSKFELFSRCEKAGLYDHLPPFVLIDIDDPPIKAQQLATLAEPIFIKVDDVYSKFGNGNQVIKCDSIEIAVARIAELRNDYTKVLVQGYVSGIGVGAFFARWRDQSLAEFMHRRIHEVPHTGGGILIS